MTGEIRLRPPSLEEVAEVERLLSDPAATAPFEWYGWRDPHRLRREWERDGLMSDERGVLLAVDDEGPVGVANWGRVPTGPGGFCWQIAGLAFPAARGQGRAAGVLDLLVRYLFDCTRVHRIQAVVEIGNTASQRLCEKAGLVQEGVLRGYAFRAGQWRDHFMYSILRSDVIPNAPEPSGGRSAAE